MSANLLLKQSHDYIFKIIVIGDTGVGKTNILVRYSQNRFVNEYVATIGIDFKIKNIEIGGKKIRLQIWDTAGQQRFRTITETYYKGASGIILVYSVTDRNSFDNIRKWIKQINEKVHPTVQKIIVANKSDISAREVSYQEGLALAKELSRDNQVIPFLEVSAKKGTNIKQCFEILSNQLVQYWSNHKDMNQEFHRDRGGSWINIDDENSHKHCEC